MTIEELTVATYKQRLEDACPGAVTRMLAEDGDKGEKLATRASSYRPIVTAVLKSLEAHGVITTD